MSGSVRTPSMFCPAIAGASPMHIHPVRQQRALGLLFRSTGTFKSASRVAQHAALRTPDCRSPTLSRGPPNFLIAAAGSSCTRYSSTTPPRASLDAKKPYAKTSVAGGVQNPSDANATAPQDLPPVPKYPCPHLTRAEAATYLRELYLAGWHLRKGDGDASVGAVGPPELAKRFEFTDSDAASRFIAAFSRIEEVEKHHAVVTQMDNKVHVCMHTHSATPSSDSLRGDTPGLEGKRPRAPGITLRDVRLAFLTQALFSAHMDEGTGVSACQESVPYDAFTPASTYEIDIWIEMSGKQAEFGEEREV